MFKRKETDEQIKDRLYKLFESSDRSISYPSMDTQVAIHELCHHLLGEDYYIVDPVNNKEANAIIVYEIERRYNSKKKRNHWIRKRINK